MRLFWCFVNSPQHSLSLNSPRNGGLLRQFQLDYISVALVGISLLASLIWNTHTTLALDGEDVIICRHPLMDTCRRRYLTTSSLVDDVGGWTD